ncbi:MAG: hypothetical protein LBN04_00065 [Oscillospiraceae bacterium]|jgi:O-antigen/teichoic acid export membrane protein|nr:hypothetical protein [Oscillospiraceae bacterium]
MTQRVENSLRNTKYGLLGGAVTLILGLIVRRVFLQVLSEAYLGIQGLFINLFSVLSLAELGVGAAITYALYKPLAENDSALIGAYMRYYRKLYLFFGCLVLAGGLAVMPLMFRFYPELRAVEGVHWFYIGQMLSSVMPYFLGFRYQLLNADQKSYIITGYLTATVSAQQIIKIILLYATRSFILYYATEVVLRALTDILLTRKTNQLYPEVRKAWGEKLPREQKKALVRNIRAMALHHTANIVVNNTDSLLMARYASVAAVGLYSNYSVPLKPMNMLYQALFNSASASIGNLGVTAAHEHRRRVFEDVFFASSCALGILCTGLMVLLSPFITLWVGEAYVMDTAIVQVLVVNLYIRFMRNPCTMTRNAQGLFWHDRYKAVGEAIVNLVVSIWLGRWMGIAGILLGTLISQLIFPVWVEGYVVYKHGFRTSAVVYVRQFLGQTAVFAASASLSVAAANQIPGMGIGAFLLKGLISLGISGCLYGALCIKNPHFAYALGLLKRLFSKRNGNQ